MPFGTSADCRAELGCRGVGATTGVNDPDVGADQCRRARNPGRRRNRSSYNQAQRRRSRRFEVSRPFRAAERSEEVPRVAWVRRLLVTVGVRRDGRRRRGQLAQKASPLAWRRKLVVRGASAAVRVSVHVAIKHQSSAGFSRAGTRNAQTTSCRQSKSPFTAATSRSRLCWQA